MGKNWSEQEDQILQDLVRTYGKQWGVIAQKMGTRTSSQVAARWEKCLDPKLTKGPFTPEEDAIISDYVSKNGPHNWPGLSQLIKNRSAKQCRERWFNHLDPAISSSPWTSNEDALIFDCIMKYGHKWSIISKFIPGRTDNSIKNRWNSSISKRIRIDQNGRKFLSPDLSRRQRAFNQQQIQNLNSQQASNSPQAPPSSQNTSTQPESEKSPITKLPEPKIYPTPLIPFPPQDSSQAPSQVPSILANDTIVMSSSFPFSIQQSPQQQQQPESPNQRVISAVPLISPSLHQQDELVHQSNKQQIQTQLLVPAVQPLPTSNMSPKPIPHFKREAAGMNLQPVITSCPLVAPTTVSGHPLVTPALGGDQGLHIVNTLNMSDNNAFPTPQISEPSQIQIPQPSSPLLPFSLVSPTSPLFQFSPIESNGGFSFETSETATPIFSPTGHSSANVFK